MKNYELEGSTTEYFIKCYNAAIDDWSLIFKSSNFEKVEKEWDKLKNDIYKVGFEDISEIRLTIIETKTFNYSVIKKI